METKPTGMLVALVFASQATDSTGESIDIKNLNTDIFDQGLGVVNYEHKSYKDSNGEEVVGKILYCKKIFNEKDCDNELQEKAWEEIQMPFLWGIIRLWDKAGHPGAISLAASIRDQANNKEKIILRASIEGNTVSRDGNKLTECIARRVTLTFSPANRTCDATLVADPNAPDGFEKNPIPSKEFPELEDALKFENPEFSRLGSSDHKMSIIDESQLNKALSAGVGNVAPSELAGGAVLASEHFVSRRPLKERVKDLLSREWKDKYDKDEVRKLIKFMLPEVSDSYLNHFEDAVEDLHLRRSGLKKSDNHLIRLHRLEIALRKSIDDLKVTSLTDAHLPCLYVLFYKADGKEYRAGRFMLYNNYLWHLEDYYKLLDQWLPEGPLTFDLVSKIYSLRNGPHTRIEAEELPLGIEPGDHSQTEQNQVDESQNIHSTDRPPSVFDYFREGMDVPHTIEINNGEYYLDGNRLGPGEVQTIYDNLNSGLATLRYKSVVDYTPDQINKMESILEDLFKSDEMGPGKALAHIRAAVAAGHLHPDVERTLTNTIYVDPKTGLGNQYAYGEFRGENKPGVHVAADLNDFKAVNDAWGHDVGDIALKTFATHARAAAEEAAPGAYKSFRSGGDEFNFHFPSYEHAAKWARSLHQKLQDTPPINGTHKLSTTLGFGHTPEMADQASLLAKETKYLPGQEHIPSRNKKSHWPLGQTPNLAHSLVPGSEGPIKMHEPTQEAIKASIPEQPEAKAA